jgi:hypothetical protein
MRFRIILRDIARPDIEAKPGDTLTFGDHGVFVHHEDHSSDFYPYGVIFRIEKRS